MAAIDRTALYALIDSKLPDNTSGAITPEDVRDVVDAIVESAYVLEDDADTAKSPPVDNDRFLIKDSAASNVPKYVLWSVVKSTLWTALGALISGGSGKTTPVDADTIPLSDSADSNATKKVTWANAKATLAGHFVRHDTATSLSDGAKTQTRTNITSGLRTITGANSITVADWGKTVLFNSSSAITVTLSAVATLGDGFWCKFKNINSGVVTLDPNSSETIDGLTTSIVPKFDAGEIHCTGSVLHTINRPPIVLLDSGTISNASEKDFLLPTGFEKLSLYMRDISPATDGANLWGRAGVSGSIVTASSYRYGGVYGSGNSASGGVDISSAGAANAIQMAPALESDSTGGATCDVQISAPDATGFYHRMDFATAFRTTSGVEFYNRGGGALLDTSAWTHFRVLMSTGNISFKYSLQGHRRMA